MRVTNPLLPKPLVQRPDHPTPHEAWSLPEVRRSPSAWAAPSAWVPARGAWAAEPPADTSATTRATHPQPPEPHIRNPPTHTSATPRATHPQPPEPHIRTHPAHS